MKRTLKAIRIGLRDLPGYGPHQESGFFLILILAAAVIGIVQGGFRSAVIGIGGAVLIYGPFYLFTAYLRGRDFLDHGDRK